MTSDTRISIQSPDRIDWTGFIELQTTAFRRHLEKYEVGVGFMKPRLYRWKYSPPSGPAKIAVAFENNLMIGCVAAIPFRAGNPERKLTIWRTADIASLPSVRGRGVFTSLMMALKEDMGSREILIGLPNANSAPGFLKVGGKNITYVPTWVRPVLPGGNDDHRCEKISDFRDCGTPRMGDVLTPRDRISIIRDVGFLDWRYTRHPERSYEKYRLDDGVSRAGIIVFRSARLMGRRVLLVLEWLAGDDNTASELLKPALKFCRERRIRLMVTVSNATGILGFSKHLFAAVPRRLVPKQQWLRGLTADAEAADAMRGNWLIQMGDLLEF